MHRQFYNYFTSIFLNAHILFISVWIEKYSLDNIFKNDNKIIKIADCFRDSIFFFWVKIYNIS